MNNILNKSFCFLIFLWLISWPLSYLLAQTTSFSGKVIGISDGDTITVLNDGKGEKIRLNGIDCPESGQDFGTKAKQFVSDKAFGKIVKVKVHNIDRYGRKVADITLPDGFLLNEKLVESGLAWWYRKYAPRNQRLKNLEQAARNAKRGIWSRAHPVPPWEFRGNTTSALDVALPGQPIKMSKSKICHAPGTTYYGRTKKYKRNPPTEPVLSGELKIC